MNEREKAGVYNMMLNSSGMADSITLNLKVTRQAAFLIFQCLESGLGKGFTDAREQLETVPKDTREMLEAVSMDILQKSNLSATYEHFRAVLELK